MVKVSHGSEVKVNKAHNTIEWFELYDIAMHCVEKINATPGASSGVGVNKQGERNTGVGTIFTPGGHQARGRLGSRQGHNWWDTSQSKCLTCRGHLARDTSHLQDWQWDGLPQNISCLLFCLSLHNPSVGCTGGELTNRKLIDEDAVDTPRWIRMPRNVLVFDSHHDGSGGSTETAGQTKEEFASHATASSSLSTSTSSKPAQNWPTLKWESTSQGCVSSYSCCGQTECLWFNSHQHDASL